MRFGSRLGWGWVVAWVEVSKDMSLAAGARMFERCWKRIRCLRRGRKGAWGAWGWRRTSWRAVTREGWGGGNVGCVRCIAALALCTLHSARRKDASPQPTMLLGVIHANDSSSPAVKLVSSRCSDMARARPGRPPATRDRIRSSESMAKGKRARLGRFNSGSQNGSQISMSSV